MAGANSGFGSLPFSESVTMSERVAEGPITDHLERVCPQLLSVTEAPQAISRNKRTVDGASTADEDDTINTRLRVRVVDITNIKAQYSISIELVRVHASSDTPLYATPSLEASHFFMPVLNVPKYSMKLMVLSPRPLSGQFTVGIDEEDFPITAPKWQLLSGVLNQPTKPIRQSLVAFDVVRYKLGLTRNTQILNRDLICGLTSVAFGAVWNVMSPKASIENGGLVYYDRCVSDRKLCIQRFAESEVGESVGLLPELWGLISDFTNDFENDEDWRADGEEAPPTPAAGTTATGSTGSTGATASPPTGSGSGNGGSAKAPQRTAQPIYPPPPDRHVPYHTERPQQPMISNSPPSSDSEEMPDAPPPAPAGLSPHPAAMTEDEELAAALAQSLQSS